MSKKITDTPGFIEISKGYLSCPFRCTAIILAAGNATRMGGLPKPFLTLNGRTMLEYSLDAFENCALVDQIIVATKPELKSKVVDLIGKNKYSKLNPVVNGGETRLESVKNAYMFSNPNTTHVAIHDAARPLIRTSDVYKILEEAMRYGAATAAYPVADSIKKATPDGFIQEDVCRKELWAVQTPQIFYRKIYDRALAKHAKNPFEVTDDNSLVTAAGFKVRLVDVNNKNYKLTTRDDAPVVAAILRKRSEKKK